MHLDEVGVFARLESAIFGVFLQAMRVTGSAVGADVTAIRIFEGEHGPMNAFVDASRLGLTPREEQALQVWPYDCNSIFEYARQQRLHDRSFRPCSLLENPADHDRFFAPITAHRPVLDSYCLSFPIAGQAWCLALYLRCGKQTNFESSELQALDRFKPAVARLVSNGYHRDTRHNNGGHAWPGAESHTQSGQDLVSRLSRTEKLVYPHLLTTRTEREIADTIHRSPHTVHVHVKNIYRKAGVNSRKQLQALMKK